MVGNSGDQHQESTIYMILLIRESLTPGSTSVLWECLLLGLLHDAAWSAQPMDLSWPCPTVSELLHPRTTSECVALPTWVPLHYPHMFHNGFSVLLAAS